MSHYLPKTGAVSNVVSATYLIVGVGAYVKKNWHDWTFLYLLLTLTILIAGLIRSEDLSAEFTLGILAIAYFSMSFAQEIKYSLVARDRELQKPNVLSEALRTSKELADKDPKR